VNTQYNHGTDYHKALDMLITTCKAQWYIARFLFDTTHVHKSVNPIPTGSTAIFSGPGKLKITLYTYHH